MEMKTCNYCCESMPVSEFYELKKGTGKYRSYCKTCYIPQNQGYIKDPRARWLKQKESLSDEEVIRRREYHKLYCREYRKKKKEIKLNNG